MEEIANQDIENKAKNVQKRRWKFSMNWRR